MANVTTLHTGRHKNVQKEPLPVQTNAMATSVASGGAAAVTYACPAGAAISVDYIDYGYRVASATGSIQITDGTLTWGPFEVIVGGLQTREFDPPLGPFTKGTNVYATLSDGGQTKDLFMQAHLEGTEVY
jgi:hypothetical protein